MRVPVMKNSLCNPSEKFIEDGSYNVKYNFRKYCNCRLDRLETCVPDSVTLHLAPLPMTLMPCASVVHDSVTPHLASLPMTLVLCASAAHATYTQDQYYDVLI